MKYCMWVLVVVMVVLVGCGSANIKNRYVNKGDGSTYTSASPYKEYKVTIKKVAPVNEEVTDEVQ